MEEFLWLLSSVGAVKANTAQPIVRRTSNRFDVREVKEQAKGKWLEILPELASDLTEAVDNVGKHVPCPFHGGKDGFRLFDDAADKGGGICNTCGHYSDGIALLQKANGWDFPHALREIATHLGMKSKGSEVIPIERGKRIKDLIEEPDFDVLEDLIGMLDRSRPRHPRLLSYLRCRGLTVLPPEELTLAEAEPYYDNGHKGDFPTLLGPVRNLDRKLLAIHRTYLANDCDGKAPVDPAKKLTQPVFKGATKGGAVQLGTPGRTMGVAEGIETALAVYEATGTPMWGTVSAGGMLSVDIPPGVELVEIWADYDKSCTGQKAARTLAQRLYHSGIAVQILHPETQGVDWLDVLVEEGPEALEGAIDQFPIFDPKAPELHADWGRVLKPGEKPDPVKEMVRELNKRHFVVAAGAKVCVATEGHNPQTGRPTLALGTPADFRLRYSNRFVDVEGEDEPIADVWLKNKRRRQYEGIIFAPGEDHPGFFNLYQGFTVKPEAGDCSLYWDHVREVICNGNNEHYQYLRKWMAHMIQRPGELPGVGIVVTGKQGTGKGVFVEALGELIGIHYMVLYRLDQVTGRFNNHLRDVLLLYANEAVTTGDKASEGVIKGLITDPTLPIEQKFVDVVQIKNCLRLIVTSNDERPVPIGMDDRRFLVLEASDAYKEDKAYFGNLLRQMDAGGTEALMYDLMTEDLTGFDVRTAPRSRYSFDVKLRGAEPIDRWWYEKLCDGVTVGNSEHDRPTEWQQVVPRDVLHKDFLAFCTTHRLGTMDKPIFGKRLQCLMPGQVVGQKRPTVRISAGPGTTVERRTWCYSLPTLDQCREAFQAYSKAGPEIWSQVTGQEQQ